MSDIGCRERCKDNLHMNSWGAATVLTVGRRESLSAVGPSLPLRQLARHEFYAACREPDLAVWNLAWGRNTEYSAPTTIELPVSDDTVELDSSNANDGYNESSGHYYICYS
jgi:hypothetical protein